MQRRMRGRIGRLPIDAGLRAPAIVYGMGATTPLRTQRSLAGENDAAASPSIPDPEPMTSIVPEVLAILDAQCRDAQAATVRASLEAEDAEERWRALSHAYHLARCCDTTADLLGAGDSIIGDACIRVIGTEATPTRRVTRSSNPLPSTS